MKAVTQIIAVIIIISLSIALVALFWIFISGTFTSLTSSGESTVGETLVTISSCMKIESVSGNKVFVKNCGEGSITEDTLNVYLSDIPFNFTMSPTIVGKDEVGTVSLYDLQDLSQGGYLLKVTNPKVITERTVEAILLNISDFCDGVLCLDFDEGTGTTAYDSSEYKNNGTLYGDTIWVQGIYDKALKFDGDADYVIAPTAGMDTTKGTVMAWVRVAGPGGSSGYQENIFSHRVGSTNTRIYLVKSDGSSMNFAIGIGDDAYIDTGSDFVLDKWTHVALVWNGGNYYAYVNGSEVDSGTYPNFNNLNSVIYLATFTSTDLKYTFNGTIDEVRIFNKILTPEEIQTEMQDLELETIILKPVKYY